MNKIFLIVLFCLTCRFSIAQNEQFTETVLANNLNWPWELTYGPDAKLWVTESKGYKVQRIDPFTGIKEELLDLSSIISALDGGGIPQGGMMGLAIHPDFLNGQPYFYLAYVYRYDSTAPGNGGTFYSTRISRFTCTINATSTPVTVKLQPNSELFVRDSLPGTNDHNSGRLAINLSDKKLYYTIGDMGAGHYNNTDRLNNAQNINVLEGKILRFNLEPDSSQTGEQVWVPFNNPFTDSITGLPTPVYSYGHRNAQGLVWADFGNGISKMYSCEHGDKTDDEINEILIGKNYMWPKASGFCDGNYNGLTLISNIPVNETDDSITTPTKFCDGTLNNKEPLAVFGYRSKTDIQNLGPSSSYWPTIAPSSIDFYKSSAIPGWNPSLILTSLKTGVIYRIKINTNGTIPVDAFGQPDTIPYFKYSPNNTNGPYRRWRDICFSPDGTTIFACTDNTVNLANPGSILKFTYTNTVLALLPSAADSTARIEKFIAFYPNPANNYVTIKHKDRNAKHYEYMVSDLLNRPILDGSYYGNMTDINISGLSKGVYLLKIKDVYNDIYVFMDKLLKL